jgi:hypothetical protein
MQIHPIAIHIPEKEISSPKIEIISNFSDGFHIFGKEIPFLGIAIGQTFIFSLRFGENIAFR